MTKRVKCVSPHGGCHNGMRHDGSPVFALPDGTIPEVPAEKLRLAPNPGGYVADSRIPGGFAAVGQVYDVPGDFYADGFHWVEDATGKATSADSDADTDVDKKAADNTSPQASGTPQPDISADSKGA